MKKFLIQFGFAVLGVILAVILENLIIFLVYGPKVKGEVNEQGLMFIIFFPIAVLLGIFVGIFTGTKFKK